MDAQGKGSEYMGRNWCGKALSLQPEECCLWHSDRHGKGQGKVTTIDSAIAKFPDYFGLRPFPGHRFRISRSSSYVNDAGAIVLYLQVLQPDGWVDFAKDSPFALQANVTVLPGTSGASAPDPDRVAPSAGAEGNSPARSVVSAIRRQCRHCRGARS